MRTRSNQLCSLTNANVYVPSLPSLLAVGKLRKKIHNLRRNVRLIVYLEALHESIVGHYMTVDHRVD